MNGKSEFYVANGFRRLILSPSLQCCIVGEIKVNHVTSENKGLSAVGVDEGELVLACEAE